MTLKQHVINQKTPPKQVFHAVQHEDSHQYVDPEKHVQSRFSPHCSDDEQYAGSYKDFLF